MKNKQFGDFQTPPELIRKILKILGPIGRGWTRVLEPTCGLGNFIKEIIETPDPPAEIVGIELNEKYCEQARNILNDGKTNIKIIQGDIFDDSIIKNIKWKNNGELLLIGNPPWVTNSEIGSRGGNNLPIKNNNNNVKGLDALTGKSNFDIAESILIKLLNIFASAGATFCFLCKSSVARNVIHYCHDTKIPMNDIEIRHIDAKKWFDASVDACLFLFEIHRNAKITGSDYISKIYEDVESLSPQKLSGYVNSLFVTDIEKYRRLSYIDGHCHLNWRQGIKHDAASIMELVKSDNGYVNKIGERVSVEHEYIYPLLKSSDVNNYLKNTEPDKYVIITQKSINEDTICLKKKAPKLWDYLSSHAEAFQKRKSSIYKSNKPFSIFGVGDYTFSKNKVMVSGLYKSPKFISVGTFNSKPVVCDDTCYLLPCSNPVESATLGCLLNSNEILDFIKCISSSDSKRPITKAILMRIDLKEAFIRSNRDELALNVKELLKTTIPRLKPPSSSDISDILSVKNELPLFAP